MINYIKKSLFVTTGIMAIACSLFFVPSNEVYADAKEGQKFVDWVVNCSEDANKKKICVLSQSLISNDKEKPQTLAMFQIGYLGVGKDRSLKMAQIVPTDVAITPGTSIISAEQLLSSGKYIACTKDLCTAHAAISEKELKKILSKESAAVAIITSKGQQLNFPFSTKGLEAGLKALK